MWLTCHWSHSFFTIYPDHEAKPPLIMSGGFVLCGSFCFLIVPHFRELHEFLSGQVLLITLKDSGCLSLCQLMLLCRIPDSLHNNRKIHGNGREFMVFQSLIDLFYLRLFQRLQYLVWFFVKMLVLFSKSFPFHICRIQNIGRPLCVQSAIQMRLTNKQRFRKD